MNRFIYKGKNKWTHKNLNLNSGVVFRFFFLFFLLESCWRWQVTASAAPLVVTVQVCARVRVLCYILDSSLSGPSTCFHSTVVARGFIVMEINQGYKHPAGHVQVRGSRRGVAGCRLPPHPPSLPPLSSPGVWTCSKKKKTRVKGKIEQKSWFINKPHRAPAQVISAQAWSLHPHGARMQLVPTFTHRVEEQPKNNVF